LVKEKINKLGSMVEEFIKYRENRKKRVSIQKFQKNFFSPTRKIITFVNNNHNDNNGIKENRTKIAKPRKFLDKNDNYFTDDNELYTFYGAIPHFASYNAY